MQPDQINYQKRTFWLLFIVLVIVPIAGGIGYAIWHTVQEAAAQEKAAHDAAQHRAESIRWMEEYERNRWK